MLTDDEIQFIALRMELIAHNFGLLVDNTHVRLRSNKTLNISFPDEKAALDFQRGFDTTPSLIIKNYVRQKTGKVASIVLEIDFSELTPEDQAKLLDKTGVQWSAISQNVLRIVTDEPKPGSIVINSLGEDNDSISEEEQIELLDETNKWMTQLGSLRPPIHLAAERNGAYNGYAPYLSIATSGASIAYSLIEKIRSERARGNETNSVLN